MECIMQIRQQIWIKYRQGSLRNLMYISYIIKNGLTDPNENKLKCYRANGMSSIRLKKDTLTTTGGSILLESNNNDIYEMPNIKMEMMKNNGFTVWQYRTFERQTLKTNSRRDTNFVVTVGNCACHNNNVTTTGAISHDDVIKWKHFPRHWPFVRGIHRSSENFQHKGQWRGALTFSLISTCTKSWANNGDAGNLRRHRAHCDVIVMWRQSWHHNHARFSVKLPRKEHPLRLIWWNIVRDWLTPHLLLL